MPEQQIRSAIDEIRTRLQSELDAQLATLEERHSTAIEAARRAAAADVDARWGTRVDELRAEWDARLKGELERATTEAEHRHATELARLREEMERHTAAALRERDEQSQQIASERLRADSAAAALTAAEHATATLRSQIDGIKSQLDALQADHERASNASNEALARAEALAGERTRLADALEAERRRAADLEAAREAVQAELTALRTSADQDLASARQQAEAAQQEVEQLRASRDHELTGARRQTEAAQQQIDALRAQLDALRRETGGTQEHIEAARQESEAARRDRDAARQEVTALRQQIESTRQELDSTRHELEPLRQRVEALSAELVQERERHAEAPAAATAAAEAQVAERQSGLATIERLLGAMRAIDGARSLTDALAALVQGAAAEAPRAVMFVVNGPHLQRWRMHGFGDMSASPAQVETASPGVLGDAVRSGEAVSTSMAAAPHFADLPADRAGLAVPITVGGHAVAVLYADDGSADEPVAPASWPEAVQILSRHASACVAHLTALRTAQAMKIVQPPAATSPSATQPQQAPASDEESGARRYARLLVSEIKLYNEAAVRDGRERRDLLARLRPEIERARRLYEERVPATVGGRGLYFQQELVQTLAGGDPGLLGTPAASPQSPH